MSEKEHLEAQPEPEGLEARPEPSLEERIQKLEAELKAKEAELQDLKDRYLRLLAEFDNYRKRMEAELQAKSEEGLLQGLKALLPILDDLDRALDFAEADPKSLIPGVRAIREAFFRILTGLGVEEVPGEGAAFDPRYHEAIGLLPGPPGQVARVYQRGFRRGDKLLRPARVAVGEEKPEEAEGVE